MLAPVAAFALLLWLLWRSNALSRILPGLMPSLQQKALSVVIVLAALAVLLRGNVYVALVMFGVSLWLLGRSTQTRPVGQGAGARISRVRSAMIEMDYDHATGAMFGRIIAGANEGVALDQLDRGQCLNLYTLCRQQDVDGARLLEAYFDRRFAGWRPATDADRDPGQQRARSTGGMSENEAYEVLGLRRGASRTDVVRSHRTLMKKWHPDQGGTAELAARANEAKEVLLRRHA